MKLLCIMDGGINKDTVPEIKQVESLGCEVVYFDNYMMDTVDKVMDCMHETEIKGPEGYPYPAELKDLVKDADIIVVHVTPLPKEVIDEAKQLKMVSVLRGGCDNVDVNYLLDKGIVVTNAAWRSSNAVADATLGMMLAETKNIARGHYGIKSGQWPKSFPNDGNVHNLATRTVGIIGFGYIGQRVAKRVQAFDAKIIVHDPFMPDEVIEKLGFQPVTKEYLMKNADIITIHLRQSALTEGFIGEKEIAMMKPTATVVNTARARLIDEAALGRALKEKRIQGAALDVFYDEPLPKDHIFMSLDNVTLTPHIAGTSEDTLYSSFEIVYDDLQHYMKNEPVTCAVRPLGRK